MEEHSRYNSYYRQKQERELNILKKENESLALRIAELEKIINHILKLSKEICEK